MIGGDEHAAFEATVSHHRKAVTPFGEVAKGDPLAIDDLPAETLSRENLPVFRRDVASEFLSPIALALSCDPLVRVRLRQLPAGEREGVPSGAVRLNSDWRMFKFRLARDRIDDRIDESVDAPRRG